MANETTYAALSSANLVNTIYEAALMHLRAEAVMLSAVMVFSDQQGLNPRTTSKYAGGTFTQIDENTDMSAEAWARNALATLTPAIYGRQFFITDARLRSEAQNVIADAALELGASAAAEMNSALLGHLDEFTGGTIGAAGGTITWGHFFAMRSRLQGQKARAPYFFACHTYQWHQLARTAPNSGVDVLQPSLPAEMLATGFTIRQVDDVFILVTPDISVDASDDAYCGMYARPALALDIRRAFGIEQQRDASRGGGGWEMNATLWFAHGVNDASQGITGIFDASAPSS